MASRGQARSPTGWVYPEPVGGASMALSLTDLKTLGIDTSRPPRPEPSPEEVTAAKQVPSWQRLVPGSVLAKALYETVRSEERRVGKECRGGGAACRGAKK